MPATATAADPPLDPPGEYRLTGLWVVSRIIGSADGHEARLAAGQLARCGH